MEIRYINDKDKVNEDVKEALEAVDKLLEPKEHTPEYKKMMATHKRNLTRIFKQGNQCPWEWGFGLDYLVEFLRFMADYYRLGENVQSKEDCEWQKGVKYTRLQTLEQTLEYYDKWQNVEDEYIKVIHHPETYKEQENEDGTVTIVDFGCHCEYKFGSAKKTYKKLYKVQTKYKKLFFKNLFKYIETWWD